MIFEQLLIPIKNQIARIICGISQRHRGTKKNARMVAIGSRKFIAPPTPVHLEMFFYPPPPRLRAPQGVFILSPNFLLCERFYMGITLWLVPMSRPFRALRMV
jgi:hypothetical protein